MPQTVVATYVPPALSGITGGICHDSVTNRIYAIILKSVGGNPVYFVKAFDTNLLPTPTANPLEWQVGPSGTPWGICCDTEGNVYVSYWGGSNLVVKKFTNSGTQIDTIGDEILNSVKGIKIRNNRLYCCNGNLISVFDTTTKNFLYSFGYTGNSSTGEGPFEIPSWIEVTDNKIIVIDESTYIRGFDLNGNHQYSINANFQLGGICAQNSNYFLYLDHQYIKKRYIQNGKSIGAYDTGGYDKRGICTDGLGNFYITDSQGNKIRKFY